MRMGLIRKTGTGLFVILLLTLQPGSGAALEEEKASQAWSISSQRLKITLSAETRGGIGSLIDLETTRNFVLGTYPLYRLRLSGKGEDLVELTSLDAQDVRVTRSSSRGRQTLRLIYDRHRDLDLGVTCTVAITQDSALSSWSISVTNNTPYGIRAIHYPLVVSPEKLGESDQDDVFIWGRAGGRKVPGFSLQATRPRRLQYPGYMALQLQAYYDQTSGLYVATYDSGGNVKHFGVAPLKEGLDFSVEHNYDERPGLDFELPYETVMGVFGGDWYAAADLYKAWAIRQHWCEKKTQDRTDIPAWVKEPRPTLQFECRADYQRVRGLSDFPPSDFPNGRFWPARKVIPLTQRYVSLFGTPVAVWHNGWEKFGNPGGPVDLFPPLEGEPSFKAAMRQIRQDGHYPYMAVWGPHWTYRRSPAGYEGWERFQREELASAVRDQNGQIRKLGGTEKTFVPMCMGSKGSRKVFSRWFRKLQDLGAVALEFDHAASGRAAVCYSPQHEHAPGYGSWMYQKMLEFLRGVRRHAKARNPESTLSMEEVCETWIQELDFALNRPYRMDLRPTANGLARIGAIPLFNYVYHEYIPLLGGDGRLGVAHPEEQLMLHAANFVNGNLSWVGIGHAEYDFDVNPEYPTFTLLRNIFQAQRTYARPYLVFGEMVRPTQLQTDHLGAYAWLPTNQPNAEPPVFEIPRVMHRVWRSSQKKIGYILVNWTAEAETVTLDLVSNRGTVTAITGTQRTSISTTEILQGKLSRTVPARSVLLLEQVLRQ